jgi:hypothetical protein
MGFAKRKPLFFVEGSLINGLYKSILIKLKILSRNSKTNPRHVVMKQVQLLKIEPVV